MKVSQEVTLLDIVTRVFFHPVFFSHILTNGTQRNQFIAYIKYHTYFLHMIVRNMKLHMTM